VEKLESFFSGSNRPKPKLTADTVSDEDDLSATDAETEIEIAAKRIRIKKEYEARTGRIRVHSSTRGLGLELPQVSKLGSTQPNSHMTSQQAVLHAKPEQPAICNTTQGNADEVPTRNSTSNYPALDPTDKSSNNPYLPSLQPKET
jgi:hypothetical protein